MAAPLHPKGTIRIVANFAPLVAHLNRVAGRLGFGYADDLKYAIMTTMVRRAKITAKQAGKRYGTRGYVPIMTGNLRRSITAHASRATATQIKAEIGAYASYAIDHELGTNTPRSYRNLKGKLVTVQKIRPKYFIRTAVNEQYSSMLRVLIGRVRARVAGGPMP